MSFYDWISILNFVGMGYLIKIVIDILTSSIRFMKQNNMDIKLMINSLWSEFKNRRGIGSLSIIVFALGIVWLANCDEILKYLNLKSWTNGDKGEHIGSCYSLIFFIPAYIIAIKYKEQFGAKLVIKLAGLCSFMYLVVAVLFIMY